MRLWRSTVPIGLGVPAVSAVALLCLVLVRTAAAVDDSPGTRFAAQESPAPSPTADPLEVAKSLAKLRFDDDARAYLKKALEADPSRAIPLELEYLRLSPTPTPTPLPTPTAPPLDVARGFAAAGFDDDARSYLKKAIEAQPSAAIPDELEYLNGQPFSDWESIRNPRTRFWVFGTSLGIVLILILGVVVVARRLTHDQLDIADFETEGAGDLKLGKSLASIVEQELVGLRREGGGDSLQFVATPDPAIAVPDAIKDLSPHMKVAAWALSLIPSRVYRVTGQLHPASNRGVGLTISIARPSGQVAAATTLWENWIDPKFQAVPKVASEGAKATSPTEDAKTKEVPAKADPSATYMRLAIAAAGWVLYAVPMDPEERARARVLTDDRESYALFRAAASWDEVRDTGRARRLYVDALHEDPLNSGVLLNLGRLDGYGKRYASAIERLELARRTSKERYLRLQLDPMQDRLWHRAGYSLAATHFHAALDGDDVGSHVDRAKEVATEVLLAASEALVGLERPRFPYYADRSVPGTRRLTDDDTEDLARFLTTLEASTAVLLAGALAHSPGAQPAGLRRAGCLTRILRTVALLILPASSPRSAAAGGGSPVAGSAQEAVFSRQELVQALRSGTVTAATLIRYVERWGRQSLSYRVRYNLACYYASRHAPVAWEELEFGLERGDFASWAGDDPSLEPLRKEDRARFDRLISKYGPSATEAASGLA